MSFVTRRVAAVSIALRMLTASGSAVVAQNKYDAGVTDTEIKVGNIMPYSGPASAYGVIGRTEAAYFRKINAEGGINGRKINFISYDDAYSPPKAVEQARRLVEGDEVFLIFGCAWHAFQHSHSEVHEREEGAAAVRATGATKWNDPQNFPWTMGWIAQLPERSADLREVYSEGKAERQDRRPLPERRLRKGLSQGPKGRPRRKNRVDDRCRGRL